MDRPDPAPPRTLDPQDAPPLRAEMPPRERGWPLAVWLVVAAVALAVSLVALDAALSWF